jgi:hypothetical protein
MVKPLYLGYLEYMVCYYTRGITIFLYIPAKIWYDGYMEKTIEIIIKELREQIAKEIEAIEIEASKTNAVGIKILAAKIARG